MLILVNKVLAKAKKSLLGTSFGLALFKILRRSKEQFTCPICAYIGPFADANPETRVRRHAYCPKCGSLERHRLQYLVVEELAKNNDLSKMSILHLAPEPFFQRLFSKKFQRYTSADLSMRRADYQVDLTDLPFDDKSYDVVFASHVLEHIKEDAKALSEIRRVLKPNGIAIVPVPILGNKTIEYPEPNPHEAGHVRAPGYDYYNKYSRYFSRVDKFDSKSFSRNYQLFVYEDRTKWPKTMPLRPSMQGNRHLDTVPVCYK